MSHKQIIFCWLPSHVGIRGNEKADKAAKSALSLEPSNLKLPYTDFKPAINKYLLNKWQLVWNTAVDNKLHSIKSILGEWRPAFRADRKEEVVLARLRIGHSFITHSYLLNVSAQYSLCVLTRRKAIINQIPQSSNRVYELAMAISPLTICLIKPLHCLRIRAFRLIPILVHPSHVLVFQFRAK